MIAPDRLLILVLSKRRFPKVFAGGVKGYEGVPGKRAGEGVTGKRGLPGISGKVDMVEEGSSLGVKTKPPPFDRGEPTRPFAYGTDIDISSHIEKHYIRYGI